MPGRTASPPLPFECTVCAKRFRCQSELDRHLDSITLKHHSSRRLTGSFTFQCGKCMLFFISQDHLKLHNTNMPKCKKLISISSQSQSPRVDTNSPPQIEELNTNPTPAMRRRSSRDSEELSVNSSIGKKLNSISKMNTTSSVDNNEEHRITRSRKTEETENEEHRLTRGRKSEDEKTVLLDTLDNAGPLGEASSDAIIMECMVCGKLFPLGATGLSRHTTAFTLRHLFSYTNEQQGSAAILNHRCQKCLLHFGSEEHLLLHQLNSTCNPNMIWPDKSLILSHKAFKTIPISQDIADSDSKRINKQIIELRLSQSDSNPFPIPHVTQVKRKSVDSQQSNLPSEHTSTRSKRTKVLVMEDRKAFFAIVSLLIDRSLFPSENTIVTEDNYQSFIKPENHELLESLKRFEFIFLT
eukprot:gene9264-12479_t